MQSEDIQLLKLIQPEIESLAMKPDMALDSLPDDVASKLNLIKAAVSMSYDSSSYKDILTTLERLKPSAKYKDNTIGSYLFGCLYDSVVDGVPIGCTPQCMGAIPGPEGSCCPYSVWSVVDGVLSQGNNVDSKTAYIYLPSSTDYLSNDDLKTLEDVGVSRAIYIYSDRKIQDLTPRGINRKVKFADNSIAEDVNMNTYASRTTSADYVIDPNTGEAIVAPMTAMIYPAQKGSSSWLWMILAIIIVALLIWWFFFRNKNMAVAAAPAMY